MKHLRRRASLLSNDTPNGRRRLTIADASLLLVLLTIVALVLLSVLQ
ncbi:MAG TPA: hypothetical protein VFA23_14650 [Dongiaceae bacterium]|nr:hypothetical protein [Dongiaceae bacterium]